MHKLIESSTGYINNRDIINLVISSVNKYLRTISSIVEQLSNLHQMWR